YRGFHKGVLRKALLNWPAHQLLYLLRGSSRPGGRSHRHSHRDNRVFALGHVMVAVPSPDERRNQKDQRDLPVLGEKPGYVVRMRDQFGVAFMSHEGSVPGYLVGDYAYMIAA